MKTISKRDQKTSRQRDCRNKDFGYPVRQSSEHRSCRRGFLGFLAGFAGISLVLNQLEKFNFFRNTFKAQSVSVSKQVVRVEEIEKVGYCLFRFPTEHDPAILVKLTDGDFRAFSQQCTHLLCPVVYQPEKARLFCACHKGSFRVTDGSVIAGSPRKPLPRFLVEVVDGWVYVKEELEMS
ncbi:MAG TPA: Rieske (2Fe-2S) protein [Verrucomicrobiales bacterium]|nr:Rieske (2Fe-2S) protein [Verrucomicrobiales bacterium]HIL72254.1 Rieske (2Fe-2S) protein [Verrucomicrobiota bacterium]